jgi:hypothetical protein
MEGRNYPQRGQKLIPRDLSEVIGKLPPSATDFEEMVLGAVMLESALEKVSFLKPQHFYDERHGEVFRAIQQLASNSEPTDFRMVVMQLRRSGKLELVGGAASVVGLTSKVSNTAPIENHARIIVEMYMRRELIKTASEIQRDAYEDTVDTLWMLDKRIEDLQFLRERETKQDGPEKIKLLWEKFQITTKPDEQPPLVCIGDTPVVSPGDHTLLVGKKKSRKSLLVVHLLGEFLKSRLNTGDEVLVFDTEQGKSHVWKTRDRLYRMTNQFIPIFYLRGQKPKDRMDFISNTIEHWKTRPKIVVIDGIRDCMSNINDPDETTEVIAWLEQLTLKFNIGIINILHLNKTDGNARGHIGSELLNKTVATIEVEYDKKTGHSIVKCESSREKEFDDFAFTHGPTGLPEIVGVPMKENMAQNEQVTRLEAVFEGESLKFRDLLDGMKAQFGIGESGVKKLIADFVRRGWILKSGKDRSPNTTYKLMATNAKPYSPPPVVQENPQEAINFQPNSDNNWDNPVTPPPPDEDDLPF